MVWTAAHDAAQGGFWQDEARPIGADVNEHLTTLLGVLVGGDGQLTDRELELFNDLFAGGPGCFVYEEMPAAGRKTGIAGRGLEGVIDAFLKAFGI